MPSYYSPQGNLEVWKEMPQGYFTVEEWEAEHPRPLPVVTLEGAKEGKLAEIKQAKTNEDNTGKVDTGFGWVTDANLAARENLAGLIKTYASKQELVIFYRDAHNQMREITYAELQTVELLVINKINNNFTRKISLEASVALAETLAEVEAIIW